MRAFFVQRTLFFTTPPVLEEVRIFRKRRRARRRRSLRSRREHRRGRFLDGSHRHHGYDLFFRFLSSLRVVVFASEKTTKISAENVKIGELFLTPLLTVCPRLP